MKTIIMIMLAAVLIGACGRTQEKECCNMDIAQKIKAFAPTEIKADISGLSERQRKMLALLVEAGKLAEDIYWTQTAPDAIAMRDSLRKLNTPESKDLLEYVMIHFGPYDRIYEGQRFVGKGPLKKPEVANYYPQDMTKEEFEKYIAAHPEQKTELESQYTVVVREGAALKAVPFHKAYPQTAKIAAKLEEAAGYCDDELFKKYLLARAKALLTDDYYESDMAWMNLKDNMIDIVIGPIENYEDALFNYKTAYECAVLVKDIEGTKDLQMLKEHIDMMEQSLPYDKKYIRPTAGGMDNILSIMNVIYFGGDCQKAVKTIASSLPNDPKVTEAKGAKKQMFRNMMEAKFDKIVVPIAQKILDPALVQYVDKKAFTGFVTLHEVSHTLGRGYVFGDDKLSVRKAMKEKYSAIEETKADILGMWNHKILQEKGIYSADYVRKAMVTYLAGLYRSIRFGAEAHGQSNLIQLNYLTEQGAIETSKDGKFTINEKIFFDKVGELAKMILTCEATGNYQEAVNILAKYGKLRPETQKIIDSLKDVPRDLDTKYTTF